MGTQFVVLLLGKILAEQTNWKQVIQREGLAFAKEQIAKLWRAKLAVGEAKVVDGMTRGGWTWDGAGGSTTPDEGLGRGFILSRDAIYRLLKVTGVPGGALRDAWRDAVDNGVWGDISAQCPAGTPLADLVRLTADALVRRVL